MSATLPFQIVPGDAVDLDDLCAGFNRGFSDYKYGTRFDRVGFERFLTRAGVNPGDCALLLAPKGARAQAVGVAILALHGAEGWCGGLAVDPAHRGQGAAAALMGAIQNRAAERGVAHLWLEVLHWNEAARRLYTRLGYQVVRELLIWERPAKSEPLPRAAPLQTLDAGLLLDTIEGWHLPRPAWQRRVAYLRRSAETTQGYAILGCDGLPVAVALCQYNASRETLHLVDVAVDPDADGAEWGAALLLALAAKYPDARLVLVNEPAQSPLTPALERAGLFRVGSSV